VGVKGCRFPERMDRGLSKPFPPEFPHLTARERARALIGFRGSPAAQVARLNAADPPPDPAFCPSGEQQERLMKMPPPVPVNRESSPMPAPHALNGRSGAAC
jgi:hypothetical protein